LRAGEIIGLRLTKFDTMPLMVVEKAVGIIREAEIPPLIVLEKVQRAFAVISGMVIELSTDGSYFTLTDLSEEGLIDKEYLSTVEEAIIPKTTFYKRSSLGKNGQKIHSGWKMERKIHIVDEEKTTEFIRDGIISSDELMDHSWKLSYQQIARINNRLDERGWSELVAELRKL